MPAGVRLAVVEEVADAVDRVLKERCDEENDDARGGRNKRDGVERGHKPGGLPNVGENQQDVLHASFFSWKKEKALSLESLFILYDLKR